MGKPNLHFNDVVSLTVMLLMIVALVAGQADARDHTAETVLSVAPVSVLEDRFNIDFNGHIDDQAIKVSIAVATDLSQFRGEDE